MVVETCPSSGWAGWQSDAIGTKTNWQCRYILHHGQFEKGTSRDTSDFEHFPPPQNDMEGQVSVYLIR